MATTTNPTATETRVTELRAQVENCVRICQAEMLKAVPDLDYAYDFADKALGHIGTLRIMTINGRA